MKTVVGVLCVSVCETWLVEAIAILRALGETQIERVEVARYSLKLLFQNAILGEKLPVIFLALLGDSLLLPLLLHFVRYRVL